MKRTEIKDGRMSRDHSAARDQRLDGRPPSWAWVVWATCAVMPLLAWVMTRPSQQAAALATASVGALIYGVLLYWIHGGAQVTAAGLYAISTSMFAGYAGLTWAQAGGAYTRLVLVAVTINLWTLCAMHLLWWRSWPNPRPLRFERGGGVGLTALLIGMTASVAALFGSQAQVGANQIAAGVLTLAIISLALVRTDPRRTVFLGLVVVALIGAFAVTVFSGFGRLVLVTMALAFVVIASGWSPGRRVKLWSLLALAPTLAILIRMRERLVTASSTSLDGLGSVVNPLRDLGLVEQATASGQLGPGYGSTFVAAAVSWVPRSLWPAKPDGFGAVLTEYFHPELRSAGYSMAAHSAGEWLFNFGILGLPLMTVVVGLIIKKLDAKLMTMGGGRLTYKKFMIVAVVVVLVAEIPSLMWVGSFTYVSRALQKLLPLMLISLVLPLVQVQARASRSSAVKGIRPDGPTGAVRAGLRPTRRRN